MDANLTMSCSCLEIFSRSCHLKMETQTLIWLVRLCVIEPLQLPAAHGAGEGTSGPSGVGLCPVLPPPPLYPAAQTPGAQATCTGEPPWWLHPTMGFIAKSWWISSGTWGWAGNIPVHAPTDHGQTHRPALEERNVVAEEGMKAQMRE